MAIRQQMIMRLLGRGLLSVSGPGSTQFLQGLITKDMDTLNTTPLVYTFLLNARGRILADFFIYRLGGIDNESFVIETTKERIGVLEKTLKLYRLRRNIIIEPLTEKAVNFCTVNTEEDKESCGDGIWLADPRVPGFGFRAICKSEKGETSNQKAGEVLIELSNPGEGPSTNAYLRHRLEWGLAEGEEMTDQIPLNMNGDITQGISFDKGCYIGQELVARTHHTGIVRRRLMPFRPIENGDIGDGQRAGDLLDASRKRMGKIISSYGELGGLCIASLHIVPPAGQGPIQLFDSAGLSLGVRRPEWWPPIS